MKTSDESVPAAAGDDYFLEVESHFALRRGTPFVISAKDWALLKSWKGEGIPLAIVIEAIDVCFDKSAKSGRKRVISSLSYCRHAVKELWSERRDLQVGASGSVPEADVEGMLEMLATSIETSRAGDLTPDIRRKLSEVASEVRQLRNEGSVPEIEQRLLSIELSLLDALSAMLPDQIRETIEERIDADLAGYKIKDDAMRERTRGANIRRRMRRELEIPRLSLFG